MKKLNALQRKFKNDGFLGMVNYVLKELLIGGNAVIWWDARYILALSLSDLTKIRDRSIYQARILTKEEALSFWRSDKNHLSAVKAALLRGEECWAVMDNNQLQSYLWLSSGSSPVSTDTGYVLPVKIGESFWLRDVFVSPEKRGEGMVPSLIFSWFNHFKVVPHAHLYCEVAFDNRASLKSLGRLQFETLGKLYSFCFLGLRFFYFTGSDFPKFSFRFYPKNTYYN